MISASITTPSFGAAYESCTGLSLRIGRLSGVASCVHADAGTTERSGCDGDRRGFLRRITAGDTAAVMRLIAPDAIFLESGKIETRTEYESNHLPADIEFESKIKAKRGPLRVTFDGRDTAWVISTAEYDEGNPEKYINTQLMVLTHDTGDWRIRSISWSSNQP
jgi:ketosteroid isomerase-like protein